MSSTLRNARLPSLITQIYPFRFSRRAASTRSQLSNAIIQATTPVAEQLAATNLWTPSRRVSRKAKKDGTSHGDRSRVNIVDEQLCDDIIKYIGGSLGRHVGCDLIDINPGAGVWSRKLHDVLQPRSHLLMEPDDALYQPFLEPLLSKPNVRLVPQSGILWKELSQAVSDLHIQLAEAKDGPAQPQRNDSLLVTANLAFFPKKRYRSFDSVALLVLYQFLSSIRFNSLFQQYGLVRILVWTTDEDKRSFLPRSLQHRKRSAVEAELACDWLNEVAGRDNPHATSSSPKSTRWFARDKWIDVDSAHGTLMRMRTEGIEIPKGRETEFVKDLLKYPRKGEETFAGTRNPEFSRPYMAELKDLEKSFASGSIKKNSKSAEWKRLVFLRNVAERHVQEGKLYYELLTEYDSLVRLHRDGSVDDTELRTREKEWNDRLEARGKNFLNEFLLLRDNLHVFRQEPPVLLWDRRAYEPLAVKSTEFFPNVECCLLDIQPKAMHRLLRDVDQDSSRAGVMFDLIQRSMMGTSRDPVSRSLEKVWPGAAEGILPHCPSLRDPEVGGMPVSGYGEISARTMNERQWTELLEGFMDWPFRPTYSQLIDRLAEDEEMQEHGEESNAMAIEP